METQSGLRNIVLKNKQAGVLDKDKTLDNVQKHNIWITGVLSSEWI
jgi:DUF1009 family protein